MFWSAVVLKSGFSLSLSLSLSLFGHSQHVGHHAAEERMERGVGAEGGGEQQHGPGRGPEHALVSLLPPLPRGLRQQYVHVRWSTHRATFTRTKITRRLCIEAIKRQHKQLSKVIIQATSNWYTNVYFTYILAPLCCMCSPLSTPYVYWLW